MSPVDLAALEWAVEQLASHSGEDEYEQLKELLWDTHSTERALCGDKTDLILFMRRFAITIPQKKFNSWRMVLPKEQRPGEVNGLSRFRGVLRATNGILCYIELVEEHRVELVHLEWFTPDPPEIEPVKATKRRIGKLEAMFAAY